MPFMVLMGLGLGFNMQPVILAVQNAVSPREIGRGHLVGDVLPPDGRHPRDGGLPVDPVLPARHRDPGADPRRRRSRTRRRRSRRPRCSRPARTASSPTPARSTPSRRWSCPSGSASPNALDLVFLVAAAVVAVGFFVLWFLPQLELRNQSGIQAQQAAEPGSRRRPARSRADGAGAGGARRRRRRADVDRAAGRTAGRRPTLIDGHHALRAAFRPEGQPSVRLIMARGRTVRPWAPR